MFSAPFIIFVVSNANPLIQEEKLEPLKNTTDDLRIRLLNRLYARKRKELKEREKLKVIVHYMLLSIPYYLSACSFTP